MKKLLASLLLTAGAVCASSASAEIVFTFAPSSQHIAVGGTATVDVSISGLDAKILSGFDLNFTYDPAIINWTLISAIPACSNLGDSPLCGIEDTTQGNIEMLATATDTDAELDAGQANAFLMFSFAFKGMTDGVTILGLGPNQDFERNFLGFTTGNLTESLTVNIGSACIAVGTGECGQVPEPSTLSLLGLALVGAAMARQRRRRLA